MQDDKCTAYTRQGTRCTRTRTKGSLCTQHHKSKTVVNVCTVREPWTALQLPEPAKSNGTQSLQKLRSHLTRGPSKSAGKTRGSIYVYYLDHEIGTHMYKIGCTERSVDERMDEWAAEHGAELTVQRFYEVRCNLTYIERAIHLYLHYCRIYRYMDKHGSYDEYAATGEPVKGTKPDKPDVRKKHKEWFIIPWIVLEPLLARLIPTLQLLRGTKSSSREA